MIVIVDDCCPQDTGAFVSATITDERVIVEKTARNLGVGGAMKIGYKRALAEGCEIIAKIDGDGQLDPKLLPLFIAPIAAGKADYTKGNRFFSLESLRQMPWVRLFGNAVLSFVTKASTGYWNLMDPTNGYTAIHSNVLRLLPLHKIADRYFFETDMLFRLNTLRACVVEVPMRAIYQSEGSNLRISSACLMFPKEHIIRFCKRIFYSYFLRDFNLCSLQLITGCLFVLGGAIFGGYHWILGEFSGRATPTGTIMISVLPIILGFEMLLSASSYDVMNTPREPVNNNMSSEAAAQIGDQI